MKNCRFCDAQPMIIEESDFLTDDEAWEVKCSNWQCTVGKTVTKPNKDDAMTAWNRAQMGDADHDEQEISDGK